MKPEKFPNQDRIGKYVEIHLSEPPDLSGSTDRCMDRIALDERRSTVYRNRSFQISVLIPGESC
jgi:hypothetical protein